MELIRKFDDGTELRIPLTDEEIERAYRDRKKYYDECDLIHKLKQYRDDESYYDDHIVCEDDAEIEIGNRTVTGKKLKELIADNNWMSGLVDRFEDALGCNDSYWESFWMTAEQVIEDEIEETVPKSEKELKRDANKEKYKDVIKYLQTSLPWNMQAEIIDKLINEGCD